MDGRFGPVTASAVRAVQAAHGPSADAMVGADTWPVLAVTVRQGSAGSAVQAVQDALVARGHPLAVDGRFGPATASAVRALQTARGLPAARAPAVVSADPGCPGGRGSRMMVQEPLRDRPGRRGLPPAASVRSQVRESSCVS